MNEYKLSELAASFDWAKLSHNARIVAGTFFGHLPTRASVKFTMRDQIPTEFTRLGLVELVRLNVLKHTRHADETQVYQVLQDCGRFAKFKQSPHTLLEPVKRRRRGE